MAQETYKTDHYAALGGVNTKSSQYLTGPTEALAIYNFDASRLGDLTGRPGSTQYLSATFSGTGILGLSEFTRLNGYSKIFIANPGGMWLAQDNSVSGISLGNMAVNQTFSFVLDGLGTIGYQTIPAVTFGQNQWDFTTFVDHHFFCDGSAFLKFNGTTQTFWGLPDCIFFNNQLGWTGTGSSLGYYYLAFAYVNERGFIGPATIANNVTGPTAGVAVIQGSTYPVGFGISAIAVYTYFNPTLSFQELSTVFGKPNANFRLFTLIPPGVTTVLGANPYNANGEIPNEYYSYGQTGRLPGPSPALFEHVQVPKFQEIFQNHLFWAGSSQFPSSAYFSDIGEPEGWNPEWEFEFRTNDGDKITAMKVYGNRLIVGKELSLHEVNGNDAENFLLREISTDYGIINNRSCCTWEGRFWFLDRKGVCQYTGSLPEIVSDKIEDIFARMNLTAAKTQAQMIYMKNRDEIWTLIPIDGSSVNNIIVIYDINANSWYFWDGPNISILAKMIGRFGVETSFYGDYSNRVNYFGTSFFGDNGVGFTSLVKFPYESQMGNSIEKFYRRLFVNADSLAGNATLTIQTRLRANYGSSIQVSGSLILSQFQNAQNFGIPAKSLSVELSHFSAVDSIRLHGYALEHRWLRNT